MNKKLKDRYIDIIKKELSQFIEIHKIIIFGSFMTSKNPNDIDIAFRVKEDIESILICD